MNQKIIKHPLVIPSLVFLSTVFTRFFVLFIAYHDVTLYTSGADLDVLKHAFFVEHLFSNDGITYWYYGRKLVYSPVTPFFLALFAYPFHALGLTFLHSVLISASLYMGIEALGIFFLLRHYKTPLWLSSLLSIFNPFEMLGVLPWGGFSLVLTSLCVTWVILIEEWEHEQRIPHHYSRPLILFFMLISALAHRTGLILQSLTLILLLLHESLRFWNKKPQTHYPSKKYLLGSLLALVLILSLLYYRVLLNAGLYEFFHFSFSLLFIRLQWFSGHVLFLYNPFFSLTTLLGFFFWIILSLEGMRTQHNMQFSFFQLRTSRAWHEFTDQWFQYYDSWNLNIIARMYLLSAVLLFLIPLEGSTGIFNAMDLSLRFINAVACIFLLFYAMIYHVLTEFFIVSSPTRKSKGIYLAWWSYVAATITLPFAILLKAVTGTLKILHSLT